LKTCALLHYRSGYLSYLMIDNESFLTRQLNKHNISRLPLWRCVVWYIYWSAMCHIPEYIIFIVSAARTSRLSKQYTHLCKKKCNINIDVHSDKCFYDTVTFP